MCIKHTRTQSSFQSTHNLDFSINSSNSVSVKIVDLEKNGRINNLELA